MPSVYEVSRLILVLELLIACGMSFMAIYEYLNYDEVRYFFFVTLYVNKIKKKKD